MTAYRYWRINSDANAANQYVTLVEVTMAATVGGTNLLGSGTASASSYYTGSPPSAACDGNSTTSWVCNNASSGVGWWAYDFGVGNAYAIVEVTLQTTTTGYQNRAPSVWDLQGSNDNTTWVTVATFNATWSTALQIQTFDVPALPTISGTHRFWRINIDSNGANSYPSLVEVTMAATVGGTNLLGSGTASADSSYSSATLPPAACDGNTTTSWVSNNQTGGSGWWAYDFGTGVFYAINQVTILTEGTGYQNRAPSVWDLQYSDNGGSWTTLYSFNAATWTPSQTQTFDVPIIPQASVADLPYGSIALATGTAGATPTSNAPLTPTTTQAVVDQTYVEVVATNTSPNATVDQLFAEVVAANPAPNAIVGQIYMEVVVSTYRPNVLVSVNT